MPSRTTKGTALAGAAALVSLGVQQALAGGEVYLGAGLVIVGVLVAIGYQVAEETDHVRPYDRLIEDIGEDTLRELGQLTGEELRRLKERASDDGP